MASLIFSNRNSNLQLETQNLLTQAEERLVDTNIDDLLKKAQIAGQKFPNVIFAEKGENTLKVANMMDAADPLIKTRINGLKNW